MPLDTSIIRQATFQPIQFKAPDRVNMLLQAAQAAQAVQGLQAARMGAERDAMLRQRLGAIQNAGETPESLLQYADVLERFGSPQIITEALKLRQSAFEAKRFKDALAQADGAPVAAPGMQPAAGGAPGMAAAPGGAPVVAPGAAPANAMAAPVNAPNQLAGRAAPPDIRALLSIGTPQAMQAANALMERYKLGQPKEAAGSEILQIQARLDSLPIGDSRRKPLEDRVRFLTTRPEPVQVNVNQPLERKEQQEKGALNVEQFKGIAAAANAATRTLPALETQERILNAGFQTGFGTDAKKVGASILSALGVPEAERFASNAETFLAAMNQSVLQRQLEQKGVQTQADAERITATGAQLGNTVQGNRFIIAVAKAQLKRDIAQRRFWEEYWRKNKTYEGAEDAWQAGAGSKSLFDAPELREFVRATTPPPAPQTGGAGAARLGGGGGAARPSGGGVDRNNPLLRQE